MLTCVLHFRIHLSRAHRRQISRSRLAPIPGRWSQERAPAGAIHACHASGPPKDARSASPNFSSPQCLSRLRPSVIPHRVTRHAQRSACISAALGDSGPLTDAGPPLFECTASPTSPRPRPQIHGRQRNNPGTTALAQFSGSRPAFTLWAELCVLVGSHRYPDGLAQSVTAGEICAGRADSDQHSRRTARGGEI